MARMPAFKLPSQVKTWLDVEPQIAVCGRDDDEPVPEQVLACRRFNKIVLLQVIHPVEVSREEDVGRRSALDLFGERRARCIGDFHGVAAFILIVK